MTPNVITQQLCMCIHKINNASEEKHWREICIRKAYTEKFDINLHNCKKGAKLLSCVCMSH